MGKQLFRIKQIVCVELETGFFQLHAPPHCYCNITRAICLEIYVKVQAMDSSNGKPKPTNKDRDFML